MNPSTEPRTPTCPICKAPAVRDELEVASAYRFDAERFLRERIDALTPHDMLDLASRLADAYDLPAKTAEELSAGVRAALLETLVGVEPPPQEHP